MKSNIIKPCISLLLLLITLSAKGQEQSVQTVPWEDEKFFSMGYSLGLNLMNFHITPSREFTASD